MDIRGFQAWLSAATRADAARSGARRSRCCRAGARARHRNKPQRRVELGVDECPALSALRERRGGFARYGAGSAALPVLLRKGCGRTFNALSGTPNSVGPAPQGALAVVRGVAWRRASHGEGLGGTLRCGGEHGVPLASPVSGGGAGSVVRRCSRGSCEGGRDLRPPTGEPEGCAQAGAQGTAAGRQGVQEARPLARAGAGSHGGGPERDDGQRCAAPGRCGGAHGCPRPGGREGRHCWSPTVARATHPAPPRSG